MRTSLLIIVVVCVLHDSHICLLRLEVLFSLLKQLLLFFLQLFQRLRRRQLGFALFSVLELLN